MLAAVFCAQLGGRAVARVAVRPAPDRAWLARRWLMLVLLLVGFLALQRDLGGGRSTEQREAARTARHERKHGAARAERGADVRGGADLRGVPVPRLHLHGAAQLAGTLPAAMITGLLFGGVHAGSAPAARPRAARGARLRPVPALPRTGSLYPCIAAHSLNNSLAFAQPRGLGLADARC